MKVSKPTSGHRYYVRFKDHYDRWQRVRAFGDKAASNELGRKIEKLVGLRAIGQTTDLATVRWLEGLSDYHREKFAKWGLLDAKVSSLSKPLTEHLDDYHDALIAQDRTERHAKLVRRRVLAVIEGCGFTFWRDIDKGHMEEWLKEKRDNGAFQQNTSNHYVRALKAFCTWMVDDSRASASPLDRLKGITVTKRKKRGILLKDQLAHLFATTALGKPWPVTKTRTLSGRQRAMMYQFAFETAIRPEAIRSLRPSAFHFNRDDNGDVIDGTVTVEAGQQKNRTEHTIPLRPEFAATMAEHVATLHPNAVVIPVPERCVPMLHADLEAADLPKVDERGNRIVFYSFRHTRLTLLMAAGVDMVTTASISGHKDSRTLLDYYAHPVASKAREAVALRMTGTDAADGTPDPCQGRDKTGSASRRLAPLNATGAIANGVEATTQLICKPQVVGSNPTGGYGPLGFAAYPTLPRTVFSRFSPDPVGVSFLPSVRRVAARTALAAVASTVK